MRTYEIRFRKTDGITATERTEWIYQSWYRSMNHVIDMALARAEEIGMVVISIVRID